ncbi:Ca-activated chloride channel family protein [Chitinophaga dinghuensis]|uniref:Ca-activated chloride channel family protein n=1 Tax=Chitinophaga dinghuensis TaxID=1539050 RepID=A0A327W857_9BACT|nr:VWA domain-containing protein [Chitinophaga dinghuensis]RAJ85648.1 Ca-activated chloride channel family protein [Chitinophaga dinghuensis]
MLRFQHTEYLWGLTLLLVLQLAFLAVSWWKRRSIKRMGDPALVEKLFTGYSRKLFILKFLLIFLAFFFGVVGLANLQKGSRMEKITRKGVDVIIALDVSKSMLATDVQPDRLTRAKQLIAKLMDKLENDRIGLVVFAGNAYLQMPLTIDYSAAKMYLSTVNPDMIPTQGTAIGQAIETADDAFNKKERKHKALILISDGEDHDETAASKTKAAFENGVVVNTIGIGSPTGSPLPDPENGGYKKDREGNTVISKLNETELKSIAYSGHGIYEHLDNNTDDVVNSLVTKIDGMEQKEFGENIFTDYNSYFQYFLGVALALLLIEFFIPEVRRTKRTELPSSVA